MSERMVSGLSVLVLAAALGGGAPAAEAGVIRGCFDNHDGDLRIVDGGACDDRKETAISWDQEGPAGVPGPQGIQGPPGPSKAIAFAFDPPGDLLAAQETEPGQWTRSLVIMAVPAGEHVVSGKFDLWVTEGTLAQCQLRLGLVGGLGPILDSSWTFGGFETVALAGSIKNAGGFPWVMTLTCQSPALFYIAHVRVNLIKVGELSQVSVPQF